MAQVGFLVDTAMHCHQQARNRATKFSQLPRWPGSWVSRVVWNYMPWLLNNATHARPNDVYIAVMGVTGSGKSSFISLCSGKTVEVGHRLEACEFCLCACYFLEETQLDIGVRHNDRRCLRVRSIAVPHCLPHRHPRVRRHKQERHGCPEGDCGMAGRFVQAQYPAERDHLSTPHYRYPHAGLSEEEPRHVQAAMRRGSVEKGHPCHDNVG